MTKDELDGMVTEFDDMIRESIRQTIDLLVDGMKAEGGPAIYSLAEIFRRRGWKTAAEYCVSKIKGGEA